MQTIGFIGLGLIGGSIAKAVRKYHPDIRILAYSRTRKTLDDALSGHVIDMACDREDTRFADCDILFLCAPVQTNISYLKPLRGILNPDCIVTDVGSVKGEMVRAAESAGFSSSFIGGHPMAGSEQTGLSAASSTLLENAYYFLTPCSRVPDEKQAVMRSFIASLKSLPLIVSADIHDRVVAGVSHVPHLIASSLVNLVRETDTPDEIMKQVAAGGFRDITRIASSSPEMWEQICLSNASEISRELNSYIEILQRVQAALDRADGEAIRELFRTSREYRNSLNDNARGSVSRQFLLYLDIEDEAGGIATITTLLAINGISIKNIGIVHNREFEEGVLRIELYASADRDHAETILKNRNYIIKKGNEERS